MEKVASIKTASLVAKQSANKPLTILSDHLLSEGDQLKLHQRLLGTLDLGILINRFFGWLSERQHVSGIEYANPVNDISLSTGNAKPHKAKYTLRLEQHYFGEFSITSQKRFSEQDLLTHEQSIGIIIHYLKNALDHQSLEKIAFQDSLTGVMNRTALEELLPKEIERAQRYQFDLAMMMIDIDHFKAINDCVGHIGGDEILRYVSAAIKSQLRKSDLPFRYGGDEFLLILPNTDFEGAYEAAERIMETLNKEVSRIPNCSVSPKLSIGLATYQHGENPEDLIRRVDDALYESKNNGRNCIS
ncbi:MAG: GGDEF domain-containing protein [Porticoccus sp.]|nr:GGDEF domain-containing protein [Porticoccus sp.]